MEWLQQKWVQMESRCEERCACVHCHILCMAFNGLSKYIIFRSFASSITVNSVYVFFSSLVWLHFQLETPTTTAKYILNRKVFVFLFIFFNFYYIIRSAQTIIFTCIQVEWPDLWTWGDRISEWTNQINKQTKSALTCTHMRSIHSTHIRVCVCVFLCISGVLGRYWSGKQRILKGENKMKIVCVVVVFFCALHLLIALVRYESYSANKVQIHKRKKEKN